MFWDRLKRESAERPGAARVRVAFGRVAFLVSSWRQCEILEVLGIPFFKGFLGTPSPGPVSCFQPGDYRFVPEAGAGFTT